MISADDLAEKDPELLTRYLTDYSVGNAEMMVDRWRELCEFLICKYNDGYVKNEKGRPQEVGYPEAWLEKVMSSQPDRFKLESWGDKTAQKDLLD